MTEPTRTITLDGVEHEVAKFSQGIQSAVAIYNGFQADLQREQLTVMKTQGALQSLGNQIAEAVKKELADAEKPAELSADGADAAVKE